MVTIVAFIVETSGKVSPAWLRFLDRILPAQAEGDATTARKRGTMTLWPTANDPSCCSSCTCGRATYG